MPFRAYTVGTLGSDVTVVPDNTGVKFPSFRHSVHSEEPVDLREDPVPPLNNPSRVVGELYLTTLDFVLSSYGRQDRLPGLRPDSRRDSPTY